MIYLSRWNVWQLDSIRLQEEEWLSCSWRLNNNFLGKNSGNCLCCINGWNFVFIWSNRKCNKVKWNGNNNICKSYKLSFTDDCIIILINLSRGTSFVFFFYMNINIRSFNSFIYTPIESCITFLRKQQLHNVCLRCRTRINASCKETHGVLFPTITCWLRVQSQRVLLTGTSKSWLQVFNVATLVKRSHGDDLQFLQTESC